MKHSVSTVIGARPQFIKAAMLTPLLNKSTVFEERLIHTGQHFSQNMSEVFFEQLNLPTPHHNLDIHSIASASMIGNMLIRLEEDFQVNRPDIVLVYGDTNSTLAGALTARKMDIPIVHIESGLRRHNKSVPEEINRLLTDHVSDLLFAPSKTAVDNLLAEGLKNNIYNVGDIMCDAFLQFSNKADNRFVPDAPYALSTIHRVENTDHPENLLQILDGFSKLPITVVLPLHPRTKSVLDEMGCTMPANLQCIPPVGYLEMLGLIKHSSYILTDSGGLQKEAAFANKRCMILREQTPWVELLEHDYARIVGTTPEKIVNTHEWALTPIPEAVSIYGTGQTANEIFSIMQGWAKAVI